MTLLPVIFYSVRYIQKIPLVTNMMHAICKFVQCACCAAPFINWQIMCRFWNGRAICQLLQSQLYCAICKFTNHAVQII